MFSSVAALVVGACDIPQPAEKRTLPALSGFALLGCITLLWTWSVYIVQRGLRAVVWTIVREMRDNGWMLIPHGEWYV